MAAYATIEDYTEYTGGAAPTEASDEEAALLRALARASSQVDRVITWAGDRDETNHLRINLEDANLTDWDRVCLVRATCAQAEYRLVMGEEFFLGGQHTETTTPDGWGMKGALPHISPAVWIELRNAPRAISHRSGVGYAGRPVTGWR